MQTTTLIVTGRERIIRRIDAIALGMRAVQRHVASEAGQLVRDSLRGQAPVRSSNLRKKLGYRSSLRGDNIVVRFHGPWYTHLVTKPTKPHDIWAGFYTGKSDSHWLFFDGSGVAHVRHPGTAGNNFVQRAYDASVAGIRELVRAAGTSLMRR